MGPGPRFEPESRDPQSPRITKLPHPGHVCPSHRLVIDKYFPCSHSIVKPSARLGNRANIIKIPKKVKSAEALAHSVDAMYGTFLSSITEEDIREFKEGFERLSKADEKTRKEFYDRVYARIGVYDENGNIAEGYRDLFPERS